MKLIPRTETDHGCLPLLLGGSAWAVRRDLLPRILDASRHATTPVAARPRAAADTRTTRAGAVAVIALTGVITPRGSFLSWLFGGSPGGLEEFADQFEEAVASTDVGAIVLDIDSPGGLIDLVPETAALIRAARGSKPIISVANTSACSAAYWLAAQADEIVVSPSGDVGSVGVYMVHHDFSGLNDRVGVQAEYISAGQYKTEGNPDEPLSDLARADWQQEVDDLYAMFVDGVAAGRGVSADIVRATYGEGRTLLAARALAAGMVDRVDTLETVVEGLLTPTSTDRGATARASRLATAAKRALALPPADNEHDDEPDDDEQDIVVIPAPIDEPDEPDEDEPDEDDEPVLLSAEARAQFAALLL